jgi:O-antigen biosynthesis protein
VTPPPGAIAVRTIDAARPLEPLTGLRGYRAVRMYVTWNGRLVGHTEIGVPGDAVSPAEQRDAVVDRLGPVLVKRMLARHLGLDDDATPPLPPQQPVSIVVATYDRPDDLRACLRALSAQATPRPVELIVVDNHPASGLTPAVVAEFPHVVLLAEPRRGLSSARNRAFASSRADIVVTTDDDVVAPADWLERLVAPFADPDVAIVTGNVLPLELETRAQQLFEAYGGLGRGFERKIVDRAWFGLFRGAVPTWTLGATANAAFRASLFARPDVGLLDEALGAGTPTGCSEDTYLFYRALKAGTTLVYEPTAYVFHRHRRDMRALRRQLYAYSKGHVAYHLTTLLRDGDPRALVQLGVRLPQVQIRKILDRLRRRIDHPLSLVALEIAGNLAGPWALWRSRRSARRAGAGPARRVPPAPEHPAADGRPLPARTPSSGHRP